jgi:hypothetical protein
MITSSGKLIMNFATKNLIILYYPTLAGGKFLSNCLSLSNHAVSQCPETSAIDLSISDVTQLVSTEVFQKIALSQYNAIAGDNWPTLENFIAGRYQVSDKIQHELEYQYQRILSKISKIYQPIKNISYYEFKSRTVNMSLPAIQSSMQYWGDYEFGCWQFYGSEIDEFKNQTVNMSLPASQSSMKYYYSKINDKLHGRPVNSWKFNDVAVAASLSNKNFFIVAHNHNVLRTCLTYWPNARTLQLVNYEKFQSLAGKFKHPHNYNAQYWPKRWAKIERLTEDFPNLINFNVDNNYFYRDNFLSSIERLYENLGYDDFNSELMGNFYDGYAKLHDIMI